MSGIYIAGPECFFPAGYSTWWAYRKYAEGCGCSVTMPTATILNQKAVNKQDNAREIFDDLLIRRKETSVIIADLQSFRGPEADGGTIFEMGMIYADGGWVYGFEPVFRSVAERANCVLTLHDEKGLPYPYAKLPFVPTVFATTTLIEGDFKAALAVYKEDLRKQSLGIGKSFLPEMACELEEGRNVFFSSWRRYDPEWKSEDIIKAFKKHGYNIVLPKIPEDFSDYSSIAASVSWNLSAINSCDAFIADLNDFRGYEPSGDTSFECGFAFGKGKPMLGFMDDIRIMRERIPNIDGFDTFGNVVEDFDFPINLMFSCSMPIIQASVEQSNKIAQAFIDRDY